MKLFLLFITLTSANIAFASKVLYSEVGVVENLNSEEVNYANRSLMTFDNVGLAINVSMASNEKNHISSFIRGSVYMYQNVHFQHTLPNGDDAGLNGELTSFEILKFGYVFRVFNNDKFDIILDGALGIGINILKYDLDDLDNDNVDDPEHTVGYWTLPIEISGGIRFGAFSLVYRRGFVNSVRVKPVGDRKLSYQRNEYLLRHIQSF
jgi:hypothetical protein